MHPMAKYKKILLVDDDETSNFLNELLIKGMDIVEEVAIASNGQEALDYLKDKNNPLPQLILLDLNMPVMDGFEFLGAFKKNKEKDVPIFILTSSNNYNDYERAKNFDVAGYLIKPLTEKQIKDVLKQNLAD